METQYVPLPRESFTEEELHHVDIWRQRVTTSPAQGDFSFFRFLDWSEDGRLGGDKLADILDMPLSIFIDGKWKEIGGFPQYA